MVTVTRSLETLEELNLGRSIAGYFDVLPLNIVSSESCTHCTRHNLPALLATNFVGYHRVQNSDIYVFGCGSSRAVDGDS
jgi:hypothetical protein